MDITAYRDEIKLRLTGSVLDTELSDDTIDRIINASLREIQRYICSTKVITIPFKRCIDLTEYKVNSVSRVMRTQGYATDNAELSLTDPMYVSQWQLLSGPGNLSNFQNYTYNYMTWNTMLQMRNTTSTDMAFIFDKSTNQLYINTASDLPTKITIVYVPRYDSVEEINSDFWIDTLCRLAVANAKVIVGRIRTKYTQTNALWQLDGQSILAEGQQELTDLRNYLQANTQLLYVVD